MSNTLAYTARLKVLWSDMDSFGHVNNTIYFRYMEQTRIEWLEQFYPLGMVGEQGPVIVNTYCNFRHQLRYPAEIDVRLFVTTLGRSSVETTYEIVGVEQPEIIYADGGAKIVWIDFKQEKSVPLPEQIRLALS